MMQARIVLAGLAALAIGALASAPASALTMQECSAKYQAAQAAGTLNGMKWNDFRKAQCSADAAPAAAAPAAKPAATTAAAPAAAAPAAVGNVVYPKAISPQYAKESAGKARMHTCLDQYNANKANNGNGGLTWIQKGGGYYSLCNKKLKS
ncbi:MAG: hypothetical protein U1E62_19670 [Alsobacter sp.]